MRLDICKATVFFPHVLEKFWWKRTKTWQPALDCLVHLCHKRQYFLHISLYPFASNMCPPSRVTLSCRDRICRHGRGQFCYRASTMFLAPTALGIDTSIRTHFGQVCNSYVTSPYDVVFIAYVSTPSVVASRQDSVPTSGAENTSFFDPPSKTLSDIIQKRDHLCHGLSETKFKLGTLEQDAPNFDVQKGPFIEHIKCVQSALSAVKAEKGSLKTMVQ